MKCVGKEKKGMEKKRVQKKLAMKKASTHSPIFFPSSHKNIFLQNFKILTLS